MDQTIPFQGSLAFAPGGKLATDGSMLVIPVIGSPASNLIARIAPDGTKIWAKNTEAPNLEFNDFHCDGTPYRFIRPSLLCIGVTVASTRLPSTVILAQDYDTGKNPSQT